MGEEVVGARQRVDFHALGGDGVRGFLRDQGDVVPGDGEFGGQGEVEGADAAPGDRVQVPVRLATRITGLRPSRAAALVPAPRWR